MLKCNASCLNEGMQIPVLNYNIKYRRSEKSGAGDISAFTGEFQLHRRYAPDKLMIYRNEDLCNQYLLTSEKISDGSKVFAITRETQHRF
jgi:hypothetical protein